jgi:hypothetical protein
MDASKNIIIMLICAALAYLEPIRGSINVLTLFFCANIVIGTICGLYGRGEKFSLRKILNAFVFLGTYLSIISALFYTGNEMGDDDIFMYIIKLITYCFLYLYARNICNCLCVLFPAHRAFKFIQWLLEVKFINKIPYLGEFMSETDNIRNVSHKSRGKKPEKPKA